MFSVRSQRTSRVEWIVNYSSTIIWHYIVMLDEHRSALPRRDPEHVDLAAIKTDLEFLMEQVARLPTRREQALKPLYVIIGSALSSPGSSFFGGAVCERTGQSVIAKARASISATVPSSKLRRNPNRPAGSCLTTFRVSR
jgi:hypothetical protein